MNRITEIIAEELIKITKWRGEAYTPPGPECPDGDEVYQALERIKRAISMATRMSEPMDYNRPEYLNQLALARHVYEWGVNIVTCGHCGAVILHEAGAEEITCYECLREFELCDCPDLFYENGGA